MGCVCPERSCLPSTRFGIRRRRIAEALPAQGKIYDPRNADSETRPATSVEKDSHGRPPRCQGGRRTRSGSEDSLPFPHTTYWGNLSQAHTQLTEKSPISNGPPRRVLESPAASRHASGKKRAPHHRGHPPPRRAHRVPLQ